MSLRTAKSPRGNLEPERNKNSGFRELKDCNIRQAEGEGKERTFTLSFSSEEPYTRWFGPEILDHAEGAVDLTRLNSIGVVLFNHKADLVMGKIERAWIENSRGNAEITFDTDEDAEKVFRKVKGGTLKGVSVGYQVDSWEEVMPGKQSADGRFTGPCSIARKWSPLEISIVSVPADATVGVGRSLEGERDAVRETYARRLQYNKNVYQKTEVTKMNREQILARQNELLALASGRAMTDAERAEFDSLQRALEALDERDAFVGTGETGHAGQQRASEAGNSTEDTGDTPETGDNARSGMEAEDVQRAIQADRNRIRQVEDLCREFGMDSRQFVDSGASLDTVRAAVIEELRRGGAPISTGARVTSDEGDKFRRAATDGLMMRAGLRVENPENGSEEFRGISLRDLAIECLAREGESEGSLRRKSSDELYAMLSRQFYNPASAFPAIMDSTIRKSIVELYNHVPTTFQEFTTKGTLPDFKETADHEYVIGGVGDFLEVPENGEIKADMPQTELLPQRKLKTYGKQFSMTRQAFINDDIGFLTKVPGLYATAAKKTIDKQVYSILFDNPAIFDGKALFHADHKNQITSGSKPTQAAIQNMILTMQKQTDQFGEPIYMTPRNIIVPVGYEFDLAVIFRSTQITGSSNNDINPLYNYPLQIVQSPVLNALAGNNACPWFTTADEASARGIQVDYLNGQETPTVRRMETPGTLGFVWDIWLDWGISVRDFRGIVKNAGVALS